MGVAVLTDARGLDDHTMQSIAREFNFSEKTFVTPRVGGVLVMVSEGTLRL